MVAQAVKVFGSRLGRLLARKSDEVEELAKVLAGMVLMGVEKRARCAYYDPTKGVCTRVSLSYRPPWMVVVEEGGRYLVVVSKHPEVCAVCPFWKPIDGGEE